MRLVPPRAGLETAITDKQLRAAVEIPAGFDAALDRGTQAAIEIYNYESELRSGYRGGRVARISSMTTATRTVTARLVGRGLPAALVKPFEMKTENVAPPEKVGGNIIGGMIPYLFILLCFTGRDVPGDGPDRGREGAGHDGDHPLQPGGADGPGARQIPDGADGLAWRRW